MSDITIEINGDKYELRTVSAILDYFSDDTRKCAFCDMSDKCEYECGCLANHVASITRLTKNGKLYVWKKL